MGYWRNYVPPDHKQSTNVELLTGVAAVMAVPLIAAATPGISAAYSASRIPTALKWFGYARRPVLSYGVHLGVPGALTTMRLSKLYAATMLAHGIYEVDRNIALAEQKEYKRLGISLMGPPGSLWVYDQIYDAPSSKSLGSSSTSSQQNGGAKGTKKTSRKSKKYTKKMIKPQWSKYASACPPGYRFRYVNGNPMCVKK